MKNRTYLALLVLLVTGRTAPTFAEYRVPLADPTAPAELHVGLTQGCMRIEAWEGDEVVVVATTEEDAEVRQVDGMFRLPRTGMDIELEQKGNVVEVQTDSWRRPVELEIKVPRRTSVHASCVNGGRLEVVGVEGDHELSHVNGAILATGLRGSVVAGTTNGGLKVELLEVTPDKSMSFACHNGGVDVTLPASTSAILELDPGHGEAFTDFPVVLIDSEPRVERRGNRESFRLSVERETRVRVGDGGPIYSFRGFNGGIFVRRGGS